MTTALLAERRDLVIDQLSSGFANGLFEVDELERRMALVLAAQTPAELDTLVTDMVPAATTALVPARRMRIVLGSVERSGPFAVPQHLAARVLWGNLELDLREARFAPGTTTIDVNVTMGNVEVIVPPGVTVEVDVSSFLANVEERVEPAETSGGPVIRIVGRVKLGNLELETRLPGESARELRWRRRDERRARHQCRRARRLSGG